VVYLHVVGLALLVFVIITVSCFSDIFTDFLIEKLLK